ncbi:MAG: histidine phosphatase family protein [Pseudomonadales bacterium]|nr:histidine phosphatase family protein [Pseudomonadales bacterium]
MKQLILVRHAKAGWGATGAPDIDRALSNQGEIDAKTMAGRMILRISFSPPKVPQRLDRIICSPAKRTQSTARAIAANANYPVANIELDKNLYLADLDTWLETIQCLPDELQFVVMVGHNPAITELVNHLSGLNIPAVVPCGMLYLQFDDIKWADIGTVKPESEFFDSPQLPLS